MGPRGKGVREEGRAEWGEGKGEGGRGGVWSVHVDMGRWCQGRSSVGRRVMDWG